MKLDQQIPIPEGVNENNFPVFVDNIKLLNQNIKSLNLSKDEIDSLKTVVLELDPKLIAHFKREFEIEKDNVHYYIFYKWLFQENVHSFFKDKTNLESVISSGYYFFGGDIRWGIVTTYQAEEILPIKCTIKQYSCFNGKKCSIGNELFYYQKTSDPILKKTLRANICSLYKIHLMPTKETLYQTVYKLFLAIRENPQITDGLYLRDLIHDIKVKLNPIRNTTQ
ncbi:MAG TPA: hypothetical protein VL201_00470 [Patescibacteria group bacterium]|jgi:hypothetical protein|nr:hypothetical protein [Patescibacteria group bacterium]